MLGKVFNNRYEIVSQLGSGGTALVYMGVDLLLDRKVTIKILRPEFASEEQFVLRFRKEAQAVASLSHPNIVSIYDVGFQDDFHYIVMEYADGPNLKAYIREHGSLSIADSVSIASQILDGLQHAHEHGIIHRDIKPHNILFCKDGKIKVTDFGIAVTMNEMAELNHNPSNSVVGSVHYIAPEIVQGMKATEASDIYATGIVLYEMLTGRVPYQGSTPSEVAQKHIQGGAIPPHKINENISMELSFVVQRAMRKNPELRYTSAKEMRDALIKLGLTGAAMTTTRPSRSSHGKNASGKPRKEVNVKNVVILTIVFLTIVVSGLGFMAMHAITKVEEVSVPEVVGLPYEEAEKMIEAAGLYSNKDFKISETIEKDKVISQDPTGKQKVKVGRVVNLVVSSGTKQATVPSLENMTRREAEIALSNQQLTGVFSETYHEEIESGKVISQSPTEGANVPLNSTVNVVISQGPERKEVLMPNLLGLELTKAQGVLEDYKLEIGKTEKMESHEYAADVVIHQSVEKGTSILEGSSVDLTVSTGPGPAEKTGSVAYIVPDDNQPHQLKVELKDDDGTTELFNNAVDGGYGYYKEVPYHGKATLDIYIDGELVYTYQWA
ncbi:MAG: protein kinase [Peptococcaceae bacterium]|nr:protein kinase [Peptococcaceae bacterium]